MEFLKRLKQAGGVFWLQSGLTSLNLGLFVVRPSLFGLVMTVLCGWFVLRAWERDNKRLGL